MTTVPAPDLPRLQAYERGKRLVVLGLVLVVYAGGWLLFAWHASGVAERPLVVWRIPARLVFLGLGLTLVASGAVVGARGRRRRVDPPVAQDDPYRVSEVSAPSSARSDRAPLVVARARGTGCLEWLVAGPFALLGSVLCVLLFYAAWTDTGEDAYFGFVLTLVAHLITFLALRSLFYRSGLVLDARRGLLFSWWGICAG